jgi:hypothetical protein
MQNLFNRLILPRAIGSLLLILAGAAAFAATPPDSWAALTALVAHLGGMALLYTALHLWMERLGGRARLVATARGVTQGCLIAVVRVIMILIIIAASGFWLWFTAIDLNEMRLILSDPRYTAAQVIGEEIVPAAAPVGYVDYSYRVSRTLAPVGRFAVPHANYPRYTVGDRIDITYAAAAPRVHRAGRVDWWYGLRRLLYWLLVAANGAAYLFLPLWMLEFRRPPPTAPQTP